MKKIFLFVALSFTYLAISSCGNIEQSKSDSTVAEQTTTEPAGQSAVSDNESQQDVVKVAVNSPDHTTLVKAVQTAELVDALSNAGPFTVFAPVNAAFDLLPEGTVETLLQPENKSKLQDILQHHVYVGVLKAEQLKDGQILGMVDGTNATVHVKDGKIYIDESLILGSATASNGVVHVMDKVILPK